MKVRDEEAFSRIPKLRDRDEVQGDGRPETSCFGEPIAPRLVANPLVIVVRPEKELDRCQPPYDLPN